MSKNLLKQILQELTLLHEQQKLDSSMKLCIMKGYIKYLSTQDALKKNLKNKIKYPIQKEMDYYMLGIYLGELLGLT